MNNLKKLGLTALAGSLAATSAYAGSLDVTGGASITYKAMTMIKLLETRLQWVEE